MRTRFLIIFIVAYVAVIVAWVAILSYGLQIGA